MINLTIEPLNHFFLRKGMSQKYKLFKKGLCGYIFALV